MKVLLIHELGRDHGGGAVTALFRLHRALLAAGVDSTVACRIRKITTDDVIELPPAGWTEHVLGMVSWRVGLNDVHCTSTFKLARFKPFLDADVINIHGWHTNFFNYLALPKLSSLKPIVGTMHDMWNLTGHCAMSYDCQKWRTGCGNCPYPNTFPPIGRDATALDWKLKNWAYQRSKITFAAPSRWLVDLARQSMIGHFDIHQVPNPVDTEIYRPLNKAECRAKLGLSPQRHVIMFVSVEATARAKGGDLLLAALSGLPEPWRRKTELLALGAHGEALASQCGIACLPTGYIHDDARKAEMYSAADVVVLPSRAENQPLVLIESLSCGTPVVAFDIGGNSELAITDKTGYLARPDDPNDLRHGIIRLLEDADLRRRCGDNGRQLALQTHDTRVHARRYIDLFEQTIADR